MTEGSSPTKYSRNGHPVFESKNGLPMEKSASYNGPPGAQASGPTTTVNVTASNSAKPSAPPPKPPSNTG